MNIRVNHPEVANPTEGGITDKIPIYWEMKAAYKALIDIGVMQPRPRVPRMRKYKSWEEMESEKAQRRHYDRVRSEAARRSRGATPQSQSLSQTKPWAEEGISRAQWYRNRTRQYGEKLV